MSEEEIKAGDIIQICPGNWFGGCLAIVSEVKSWGVTCYVTVPHGRDVGPGCAFYRSETGRHKKVGRAAWDVSEGGSEYDEG